MTMPKRYARIALKIARESKTMEERSDFKWKP